MWAGYCSLPHLHPHPTSSPTNVTPFYNNNRCIKYLRLFTNKGRKLTVGQIGVSAVGQARNVTKNRNNGLLVAVKGWQDPPKQYGEFEC